MHSTVFNIIIFLSTLSMLMQKYALKLKDNLPNLLLVVLDFLSIEPKLMGVKIKGPKFSLLFSNFEGRKNGFKF